MRHRKHGRKLGRTSAHRTATLRNLVCNLFLTAADAGDERRPRITTTVPKAKEARRLAERCITVGKRGLADPDRLLASRRRALQLLGNRHAVRTLFRTIAPLYNDRHGGYTRILRLAANRLGDGADLCYLELVTEPVEPKAKETEPVAPKRATTRPATGAPDAEVQPASEEAPGDEPTGQGEPAAEGEQTQEAEHASQPAEGDAPEAPGEHAEPSKPDTEPKEPST